MQLINKKFLLYGGKGGVGKTSMAAATALHASAQGKKVLVMSTDPAHSLSDSFAVEIGDKVTRIKPNLDALEIDPAALLVKYKEKYGALIKQIADEGTFFSKEDIQQFFDLSLPGMDELMALLKVIDILAEGKYDLLILDTAPTGHTIRLLELPELMTAYVRVLAEMRRKHHVVVRMMVGKYIRDKADEFINKMHTDIERLKLVLKDSDTVFVPVLIPEAMAIRETERLTQFLDKHQIHTEGVIVNRVMMGACQFCTARQQSQEKYLTEIQQKFGKVREVPLFPTEIKGNNLAILSAVLSGEKYQLPHPVSVSSREPTFTKFAVKKSTTFLLFGGKGGVGKTSCAAAVALQESKKKKVLIFSTDPAHSLSDSFGVRIGRTAVKVNQNLSALEIDSYLLLENLKKKYRKEIHDFFSSMFKTTTTATIDAPFDRKVMEGLFDLAPPGIDEIMALKTMMDLMTEGRHDLFILDTAPTGHTIRLLEMPEIAEQWVATLLEIQEKYPISFELGETLQDMLQTIKKVREMLADASKSEFVCVAIPEAMSVLETTDLVAGLKKLQVFTEYLIINKLIPPSSCNFCSAKRAEQMGYVAELEKLKLKNVGVPLFSEEIRENNLEKLANHLY